MDPLQEPPSPALRVTLIGLDRHRANRNDLGASNPLERSPGGHPLVHVPGLHSDTAPPRIPAGSRRFSHFGGAIPLKFLLRIQHLPGPTLNTIPRATHLAPNLYRTTP